jgi:hypothetical protein
LLWIVSCLAQAEPAAIVQERQEVARKMVRPPTVTAQLLTFVRDQLWC